jgi:hypothetical protein
MSKWQPIETAPKGTLVVCGWINDDGEERHNFDYFEDDVWQNYFNEHEHYLIAGAAKGLSEDAPYTHWLPIPALPSVNYTSIEDQAKKLYNAYAANDPIVHCNRFPSWGELSDERKFEWRRKAMLAAQTTPPITEEPARVGDWEE